MKVILVDDEPIALDLLNMMLSKYEDISIAGSYTKPLDALEEIVKIKPDVIFLDIEMGDVNGLEVAELFVKELKSVEIVFVTAYSEYAVDAFEVNAMDYLLKPIQEERLEKTLGRLGERIKARENKADNVENHLLINSLGVFKVRDSRDNYLVWRTQKAKELFAYLWHRKGKTVSKIAILDEIFYDRDSNKANTLLHTTIYQLRKNLCKLGYKDGIIYINNGYQLNVPMVSDLEDLEKILAYNDHDDTSILKILEIYKGDFLEEEGYHWGLELQQVYRDVVLGILIKYSAKQLKEKLLTVSLKLVLDKLYSMDGFNEQVVNMIIDYYGIQGNKANLQIFFSEYVKAMWEEMKLKPGKLTVDLYEYYMNKI